MSGGSIAAQQGPGVSVFIDSSVLIAAAISPRGSARDIIRQALRGRLDIYISPEVIAETARNLALKAPEALADFRLFMDILPAKLISPPESLVSAAAEVVAPKDAGIVAAAAQGHVAYLATYDRRHILRQRHEIEAHFGMKVVTPDEVPKG